MLEKAMPYVQIVRAFSSSVIALCKRLYCVPFDVDELFFTTFFAECEMYNFGGGFNLTSRNYDGGFLLTLIENEDMHNDMIWSSFNYTSELVLKNTQITHIYIKGI